MVIGTAWNANTFVRMQSLSFKLSNSATRYAVQDQCDDRVPYMTHPSDSSHPKRPGQVTYFVLGTEYDDANHLEYSWNKRNKWNVNIFGIFWRIAFAILSHQEAIVCLLCLFISKVTNSTSSRTETNNHQPERFRSVDLSEIVLFSYMSMENVRNIVFLLKIR